MLRGVFARPSSALVTAGRRRTPAPLTAAHCLAAARALMINGVEIKDMAPGAMSGVLDEAANSAVLPPGVSMPSSSRGVGGDGGSASAATATTTDDTAAAAEAPGYAFFEDQFSQAGAAAPRFDSYEDQLLSATAKNCDERKQPTESEKMQQLHDWKVDDKGVPVIPENYGWAPEWGPEPGEEGHNEWYKKERMYMSTEEKAKYDMGMQCAVRKNMMRHQETPYQKKVGAAARNLIEEKPMFYSTKDRGVMAPYSDKDKQDHIGPARQEFIDEWLAKPGVTPENLGKKIAEYNGTSKRHTVAPIPRKPEWQMAPITDD